MNKILRCIGKVFLALGIGLYIPMCNSIVNFFNHNIKASIFIIFIEVPYWLFLFWLIDKASEKDE